MQTAETSGIVSASCTSVSPPALAEEAAVDSTHVAAYFAYCGARSTAGAIHRQISNAICTLNTASGSSKLCPHSSIA
ncbi:hypothetical protein LAUMK191_02275 [Mycobacterium attenuatum]|uniref:Uncharacterized protein n=1 Tax=Mycobacterium attenuatum TaxID=2341086 RepID=A0A498Q2M6_9MYCO|nr:hypothetical protein LAUMK136_02276 [Mycobacterium attenuatum]VBA51731.1 hypothetical protein LAUMK191_02275 [Mycobacterium attenuatum]VBA57254.1 hypothetical protein LAUMK41_02362 [Mycobacterium attenuatum]